MDLTSLLTGLNETLTACVVFPAMILLGLYLTYRLRFVQVTKLKAGFTHLLKQEKDAEGSISHFEAISAVLAGNFGTGNISGMAVALTMGGPGALVWMWIMAFLGASIQYVSCVLGVKYRTKNSEGECVGGPMYYLSKGLNAKSLAIFFALLTLFASITVGNFAQINSMTLPLKALGFDPLLCGLVIAAVVAVVMLGGLGRVSKLASLLVPLKAALYLGTALIILYFNLDLIIPAFKLMFSSAFTPLAVGGGVMGFGVLKAMSTGFERGLFATDAGTGIVPILQSSTRTSCPFVDGMVTLVAPFLVMIVCTVTGLVLIVTGAYQVDGLQSTNMVTYAFRNGIGHDAGAYVVIVALILFGYTTILAWGVAAERAGEYLFGTKQNKYIRWVYILLIPIGAMLKVDLVWILADLCISLMVITNMIAVAGLSSEVIGEHRLTLAKKAQ